MFIPQPRFILRKPNDNKPTAIQCHLRFNGERIVFSTGEKIHPDEWDSNKQRAINSKKYPHNTELNMWLEKIDTETKFIFRNFNLENITPNRDCSRENGTLDSEQICNYFKYVYINTSRGNKHIIVYIPS
jgi:hypothetical protein